jgi:hypothetical protein
MSREAHPHDSRKSRNLRQEGFSLAQDKFRRKKRGQAFYVTGLSISDPGRPRAPKYFKKGLRQELYYIEKFGLEAHLGRSGYPSYQSGINKIGGKIRFLFSVEPELAMQFKQRWDHVLASENKEVLYHPLVDQPHRSVSLFVDESEIETPAGKLLFVGCVATEDSEKIRTKIQELRDNVIADPYAMGRKDLKKRGLHWAHLVEDVRTAVVELIAGFPLRVYVAYVLMNTANAANEYQKIYLELLTGILRRRFVAFDGCSVEVVCEKNSQVQPLAIEKAVESVYAELEAKESRRPRTKPLVKSTGKSELCLALPDCVLAVLGAYASNKGELARNRFERLRGKYRLIDSRVTDERFTRRLSFIPWQDGDPRRRRNP